MIYGHLPVKSFLVFPDCVLNSLLLSVSIYWRIRNDLQRVVQMLFRFDLRAIRLKISIYFIIESGLCRVKRVVQFRFIADSKLHHSQDTPK